MVNSGCLEQKLNKVQNIEQFIKEVLEGEAISVSQVDHFFEPSSSSAKNLEERKQLQMHAFENMRSALQNGFEVKTYDQAEGWPDIHDMIGETSFTYLVQASSGGKIFYVQLNDEGQIKSVNPMISGNKIIGWF